MHPPFLPSKFWFFIIIISLILILLDPQSVFANDGSFSSCGARFRCGDLRDIGYPFWGLDPPESCGYPGFELNCNEDEEAEITIMSVTYRVLSINSSAQVLGVARTDYSENICQTHFINSTFNSSFTNNSDTQNITLYYGCQPLTGLENLTANQARAISSQFNCLINGSNMRGYYVTRDITFFGTFAPFISNSLGFCKNSVVIQALSSEVQSVEENHSLETLNEALRVGFKLKWFANDSLCSPCINSGGQCGHNLISNEFICYCSNGSYPDVCPPSQPGTSISILLILIDCQFVMPVKSLGINGCLLFYIVTPNP